MEFQKHSKSSPRVRLDSGCVLEDLIEEQSLAGIRGVESSEMLKQIEPTSLLDLELSEEEASTDEQWAEYLEYLDNFSDGLSEGDQSEKTASESADCQEDSVDLDEEDEDDLSTSQDSFSTSLEPISRVVVLLKSKKAPRYTAVNNPAGNRKYQKWLKTTALAKLVQEAKVKLIEGSKAVIVLKDPEVRTKKPPTGKPQDVPDTTQRRISKFGHGRKHKIIYKGPICYKCSGKHHIRDCGAKMLKGKRSRKARAKAAGVLLISFTMALVADDLDAIAEIQGRRRVRLARHIHEETMKRMGIIGIGSFPRPSTPGGLSHFTPTMKYLHGVIDGEAILTLARRIWKMNADELKNFREGAQQDRDGLQHVRLNALEKLEEDRTSNRSVYGVLLTVDDGIDGWLGADHDVIESLILNTTGYCFQNCSNIRHMLQTSSDGPGAYITTLVSRVRGVSQRNEISRYDWRKLRNMVYSYLKWQNGYVPEDDDDPNYEEFWKDAETAAHIESHHYRRDDDFNDIHEDTVKGRRSLATPECWRILEVLDLFVNFDSGPNADLPMKQSLIFVGSSYDMRGLVEQAGVSQFPGNNTKPFSLVLGCLLCMDTDIVPLNIPVLRVWREDQLLIAQETLRWLTGAHGEVNSINPEEIGIMDSLHPDADVLQGFARVEKEKRRGGYIRRNKSFDWELYDGWRFYIQHVRGDEEDLKERIFRYQRIIDKSRLEVEKLKEEIEKNRSDISARKAAVQVLSAHLPAAMQQEVLDAIQIDEKRNESLDSSRKDTALTLERAEIVLEFMIGVQESLPDLLEYLEQEWDPLLELGWE
ncbi:hypothetical protein VTL71DRAFT_2112 [Oculimacula yallundae]|uniref:Uncharacterized protein n=1 Tax=Oculimacula yallundae TaxID=86028 RepID=A0ABR4C7Y4_9HELO